MLWGKLVSGRSERHRDFFNCDELFFIPVAFLIKIPFSGSEEKDREELTGHNGLVNHLGNEVIEFAPIEMAC